MGRGKIEIKKIESSTSRQVTYSKRRNGILKKAKEISILCDANVSLVMISEAGSIDEYSSSPLVEQLARYQKETGNKLWDAKHERLSAEIDRVKKENSNLQIELRHLKGEDLKPLGPRELYAIENDLEDGYACVRDKIMEQWTKLKRNGRRLEAENKHLSVINQHQQQNKWSWKPTHNAF